MSWLSAVPDVLACVGLFFVPGLVAVYLGGLRGITAWATAPLVTVAVAAAVAVAGGFFGFRFGLWPVAAGTIVSAGVAAGLALLLRARGIKRPPPDPRGYSLAVVVGAVLAVVVGAVTFLTGVRRPDAINQTWDSVFHYSAVRYIEQTGKASPLTIGTLGQPGSKGAFYPDAWHVMAALLAELTGAPVPVAATVTCLVIAVLVWPLGCLLLARQLFGADGGRATAAVVITGMVCSLFGAFPWMLTGGWGVLWPNALGMALAPAGVALGLSILRVSDGDTFGGQRWLFGVAGAWAILIAHPNSALSVAVVCLFPFLLVVCRYLAGQYRRRALGTTLVLLAVVAVVAVGASLAYRLPVVQGVVAGFWAPFQTPAQAVVSALSDSTNGLAPELLLATFSIVGMVACFIWRKQRWLVVAELAIVVLYAGSAGSGSHFARLFTGLWYDDSHRIAATLPIVAIPLTTMGVLAVGEWLLQAAHRLPSAARLAARPAVALALALAIGAAVTVAAAAQSLRSNAATVASSFNTGGDEELVSPSKLQFFQTVARLVPASALVADNPTGGTAYLFALSGTRVLYPQMAPGSNNTAMTYLAHNLVQLGNNPRACDLVRHYGIDYMIIAPENYVHFGARAFYAGVADPGRDSGFRLIASAAHERLRLYKITMCQPGNQADQVETAGRPASSSAVGRRRLPVDS